MSVDKIVRDFIDLTSQEGLEGDKLLQSFSLLAEHLRTSTLEASAYDTICKAIIDNTLPKLALLGPKEQQQVIAFSEFLLNHGDSDKVFHDLCVSLKRTDHALPVNAQFLSRFVRKSNAGVEKITRVLAKLESHETVSFLLHLPSLVMNALGSSESDTFPESEYFASISEGLCIVCMTSDQQSSSFIGTLLRRMVTMGKADILVSSCCAFEKGRYLLTVLHRVPHASMEALVRAILEIDVTQHNLCEEGVLKNALCSLVVKNATAAQACIGKIPFSQPPLKKSRIALYRLVEAVAYTEGASLWKRAITTAANVWNSSEFTYYAEVSLQHQVTRLLLYYMSRRIRERMCVLNETDGLVLLFSAGIQLRLSENDPRIRRHGMVIGEAASRTENGNQILSFPRNGLNGEISSNKKIIGTKASSEDSDSDLSTLANEVDRDEDFEQTNSEVNLCNSQVQFSSPGAVPPVPNDGSQVTVTGAIADRKPVSSRIPKTFNDIWPLGSHDEGWQYEDDWESVNSWNDDDSALDELSVVPHLDGFEGDGTAIRVPISVNHLLQVMINANKSRGGALSVDMETVAATLDQISALPNSGLVYGDTLRRAAVELCLEVSRLDVDRYPDEDKDKLLTARQKALEQMICVDLQGCGLALIDKVICGPTSDVSSRVNALNTLTKAFRLSHKISSEASRLTVSDPNRKSRLVEEKYTRIGERETERAGHRSESGKTIDDQWPQDSGIYKVFHNLAQRMCDGGGAGFLNLESRDSQLWGHAIVAIATMASCAGTSREAIEMRTSVIEISMRQVLKLEVDAIVRRAVVLAVIIVIQSMGGVEVSELLLTAVSSKNFFVPPPSSSVSLAAECFEWLSHATEFDSDIGVRRFAKQALGIWARRVQLDA